MKVVFLRSFLMDIKKCKDRKMKEKIKAFILLLERVECLEEVAHVKKLSGYSSAYRWRVGDYRLGFYKYDQVVELTRFVKRNDIYKVFP